MAHGYIRLRRLGGLNLCFHRWLSRRRDRRCAAHERHNRALRFPNLIETQTEGAAAQVEMGRCWLRPILRLFRAKRTLNRWFGPGYNACGWVAIYNALRELGTPVHPAEIVRYLEEHGGLTLDGTLGTNPMIFARALEHFGHPAEMTLRPEGWDARLRAARTGILCYQNAGSLSAHNISVTWDAGCYRIHNLTLHEPCTAIEALIPPERRISLTVVNKEP